MELDISKVRNDFPGLEDNMIFFDNAGGTQVARQVTDRITDYLLHTNVQLGASYNTSVEAGKRVFEARKIWSQAINAKYNNEVVFGSSTTALLQNLSRSLSQLYSPGDEIIVSDCDHEANIGPWVELEKKGIVIKTWKVNPDTYNLDLSDLDKLITSKTKLVAFTHVSNILGTINPIKEITEFIHSRGAKVCVDGVAFAPHRLIDVQDWNVDFYVFSLYKVYGPHYSLLYGKRKILEELPGINHYFIGKEETPYKLQPGNVNFELSYGSLGILDYLDGINNANLINPDHKLFHRLETVFNLIAEHEEKLARPLIEYLNNNPKTDIIGSTSHKKQDRVPTISFTVKDVISSTIPQKVDEFNIGIRWGDFYARRLIENLGLSNRDGIIRVSMVHYNTPQEVERLIEVFDTII